MNVKANNKMMNEGSLNVEVGVLGVVFVNLILIASLVVILLSGLSVYFAQEYCLYMLAGLLYSTMISENVAKVWPNYKKTVIYYYSELISQSVSKLGYASGLFYCVVYFVTKVGMSLFS